MTLRDLEYVCAVADFGHFGKAAEASHVGQPTLSGQIRKLEEYLGVTLFERTKRSVRLTPVGEQIVEVARTVLSGAKQIEQMAEAHRDPAAGQFRLGIIPTIAPYLIPRFMKPLRQRFPFLKVAFVEEITDGLIHRLRRGDLEAAIIATAPEDPQLLSSTLYREPFWVAMPKGHRLADSDPVDPSELNPDELLLLTDGHCLREQALEVCGLESAAAGADTTATSLETVVNLVSAGEGITLVPALALCKSWSRERHVLVRRFSDPSAQREVRMVYRSGFPHQALLGQIGDVIRKAVSGLH